MAKVQLPTPPTIVAPMLAANKATADHVLKRLDVAFDLASAQVTNASKWLLATLVAINGGGVLATVNLLPRLPAPVWPASIFAGGLLLAVISGVAIQHFAEATLPGIEEMAAYWRGVAASGMVDPSQQSAARLQYDRVHRWGLIAPGLGWIAGICFFAGLVVLSLQVSRGDPSNNARCLALQRDMLSAAPRKKDGPALFQAFGCHPQGEGNVMVPAGRK